MFFHNVESTFFIKDVSAEGGSGTYFHSIYGKDRHEAFVDFIEWLLDVDFDVTDIDKYIKEAKERGYNRVIVPCDDISYYGCAGNVLERVMPDDIKLTALFSTSSGEQEYYEDLGRLQLYKLVNDYEGRVEDSVMFIAGLSNVKTVESYVKYNF